MTSPVIGPHEQGVDSEVAAAHIPMCAREFDMRRPASIFIVALGSKCGNFITVAFLNHNHDAKTYTHRHRMRKKRTDLLGPRRGNNVIISWLHAAQEITHASTHEVGFMASILQATNNTCRRIAGRFRIFRNYQLTKIIFPFNCLDTPEDGESFYSSDEPGKKCVINLYPGRYCMKSLWPGLYRFLPLPLL